VSFSLRGGFSSTAPAGVVKQVTPEPNANLVSSGYLMAGNPQDLPF
jgi:hypothetical protein